MGTYPLDRKIISASFIGTLLRRNDKDERHRGQYKHAPQQCSRRRLGQGQQIGIVFETASPLDTPRLMQELVEWTNAALDVRDFHPLLVIGIFIVSFLAIHPFQDGNGRLSRILTTLLLLRCGVCPYALQFTGKRYRKQQRGLLSGFAPNTDEHPNGFARLASWLLFFLRALHQQMKRCLKEKMEQEHIVMAALPELSLKILDYAREHGARDVEGYGCSYGVSRNTLKEHFRKLVANGQLVMRGVKGRGHGIF